MSPRRNYTPAAEAEPVEVACRCGYRETVPAGVVGGKRHGRTYAAEAVERHLSLCPIRQCELDLVVPRRT